MQSVLFDPVLTLSLVHERRDELMAEARQAKLMDQMPGHSGRRTLVHLPVAASLGVWRTSRVLRSALRSVSFSPARF